MFINKVLYGFTQTDRYLQYYFFCGIKGICRTMLHGFMHNHAEAKKHVQEDKKNRRWRWTVLNGGI
jgi:hypothetical protein